MNLGAVLVWREPLRVALGARRCSAYGVQPWASVVPDSSRHLTGRPLCTPHHKSTEHSTALCTCCWDQVGDTVRAGCGPVVEHLPSTFPHVPGPELSPQSHRQAAPHCPHSQHLAGEML